jgi:hypothetical protein
MNVLKTIGFTQSGAAYNYAERMAPIKTRFMSDFNDAINRMRVIKVGLKKIYNYEMKVPNDPSTPFERLIPLSQVDQYLGPAGRIRNGTVFDFFGRS